MIRTINRRQFLLGAGGVAVALPFLPSLAKRALAQTMEQQRRPNFVCITSEQGGVWTENMYPDLATQTPRTGLASHTIHAGALQREIQGADAVLSPVLRAPASALTPELVAKMNVLLGVDHTFETSHQTGAYLGNYGRNDVNDGVDPTAARYIPYRPTIDQVMAWSNTFYPNGAGFRERSVQINPEDRHDRSLAWGYSNPVARTGTVQALPVVRNSRVLFDQLFVQATRPTARPTGPVINQVIESCRQLERGGFGDARRLSAADRHRLTEHIEQLNALDRNLSMPALACDSGVAPTESSEQLSAMANFWRSPALNARAYQLYNDVVVAALRCGATRIVTMRVLEPFSDSDLTIDWHGNVAHTCDANAATQALMTAGQRGIFRDVFLDLVRKLDVSDGSGTTTLDNSLVFWSQEAGCVTHNGDGIPIVAAGGAGGYLNTGLFVDYRNRDNRILTWPGPPIALSKRPGLPYQRWLATALLAMGMPREEWERPGETGYGHRYDALPNAYSAQSWNEAGQVLPLLRRA